MAFTNEEVDKIKKQMDDLRDYAKSIKL